MDNKYIIIDNGSGYCKAGFSGDGEPKVIIPTVIGHPKISGIESDNNSTNIMFGQSALDHSAELTWEHPVQKGIVTDWNEMRLFLDNLFTNELKINPQEYGFFFTETPWTPKSTREKLTDLWFEHYQVPSIFITNGATWAWYGAGKFSGIVVDSGYDTTRFVPIQDGYPFSSTISQLNLGGKDITEYLQKLFINKGITALNTSQINKIKEEHCYWSADWNREHEKVKEVVYKLPDKQTIHIKDERYLATELFFHPEYNAKEWGGIARWLCESMYNADHYIKKEIEGNIVIVGGNTLFPGFPERFASEIKSTANGLYKDRVKVTTIQERKVVEWIGGSIFSLMSIFSGLCTTKKEYNEYGSSVVHNKCFY